ncbi:hypothetical protein Hypma_005859, partial [Hypsizygus marmoreus]
VRSYPGITHASQVNNLRFSASVWHAQVVIILGQLGAHSNRFIRALCKAMTGFVASWFGVGTLTPTFPPAWGEWIAIGMAQGAHFCPHLCRIPNNMLLPSPSGHLGSLPPFANPPLLVPASAADRQALYDAAQDREQALAINRACVSCVARGLEGLCDTRGPGRACSPCVSFGRGTCSLFIGHGRMAAVFPRGPRSSAVQALTHAIDNLHDTSASVNHTAALLDAGAASRFFRMVEVEELAHRFHQSHAIVLPSIYAPS